uniref:Fatty acyl-CoA reductase n=1 Tax=Phlebotomus papatasi TaxID=29031 RepID=A0A1B0DE70_PHLPP
MKPFELPAIADFFRGREIFITGGTGFLGKAIIEKILYSCPDVKRIYLLLRCKKSVSVCDRLVKFKSNQIFNRVRERDESLLDKIEALPGDSMCLKLGLSEEDIEKMENVSVIINSAASVRFDEPLGQAVFMNTRSARELCLIAEKLKNLKVLIRSLRSIILFLVTPSVKEPFEGWVDNFNGITGILAAGGSGLARALYGSTKVKNNFQPLDVCVRSLLVATWKRGRAIGNEMAVYNCACSKEREVQIGEVFSNCCKICVDVPLDEMIWLPNATLTTCFYFYKIILFLFQVFPGMIFDFVLKIIKKKPIALFIMRKFHFASSSLSYFMFRDWLFVNDNCFNLMNDIKNEDMEAFGFDFYESIGIMEYMYQSSLGGRRYLMNQPDENLPRARRNYRIFWLLDRGNLKVLVHISTTYCNTNYPVIEEKVYPPLADWRETIKMAESVDTDILEIIAKKYMDFQPNTYTFTKHLAEQIMNEWSGKLPIIIFRPSIMAPSVKEPFEGWVDNFNGIIGLVVAGGSGIARVYYFSQKIKGNFQPLDVCVRSLLVATWKHGQGISNNMVVYNCACSREKEISGGEIFSICSKAKSEIPFNEMIWLPNATVTSYYFFYKFILFLFQVFPGMIFDLILKICNKKAIVLFFMRKFHYATCALSYFLFKSWYIVTENYCNLMNDIKNEDVEEFRFDLYESFDLKEYMYQSTLGGRRYLLNQPDEDLPQARRNYRIFWLLDRGVKLIFWSSLIYFLITRYDLLNFSNDNILLHHSLKILNISSTSLP